MKMMSWIKCRCIRIGNFNSFGEQSAHLCPFPAFNFSEQLYCFFCPKSPMPKKASDKSFFNLFSVQLKAIRCEQVTHDVVVIAGVQRNLLHPIGLAYGPHHVECLVPVESGNLDGSNILVLRKPAPEIKTQNSPTNGRLQIKAKYRNDLVYRVHPLDQFFLRKIGKSAATEQ